MKTCRNCKDVTDDLGNEYMGQLNGRGGIPLDDAPYSDTLCARCNDYFENSTPQERKENREIMMIIFKNLLK